MTGRMLICVIAATWTCVGYAHHNATSHYQLDKTIDLEGVVTNFRMVNPHVQLYFDVTSESGDVEHWIAEGNSVGVLMREGWTRDELKKGDTIRLSGRPSRDGSHRILWTTITKVNDGTVLFGGNSISTFSEQGVPEDVREHVEGLRKRQIEERDRARDRAGSADDSDENDEKLQPTQSY